MNSVTFLEGGRIVFRGAGGDGGISSLCAAVIEQGRIYPLFLLHFLGDTAFPICLWHFEGHC